MGTQGVPEGTRASQRRFRGRHRISRVLQEVSGTSLEAARGFRGFQEDPEVFRGVSGGLEGFWGCQEFSGVFQAGQVFSERQFRAS